MTKKYWLDYAKEHQDKLLYYLNLYHPRAGNLSKRPQMHITAHRAQMACNIVVANEVAKGPLNVEILFKAALNENNINVINRLLNDAWFAVPESRECWNIQGFREAVTLMESLPEEDNE